MYDEKRLRLKRFDKGTRGNIEMISGNQLDIELETGSIYIEVQDNRVVVTRIQQSTYTRRVLCEADLELNSTLTQHG